MKSKKPKELKVFKNLEEFNEVSPDLYKQTEEIKEKIEKDYLNNKFIQKNDL